MFRCFGLTGTRISDVFLLFLHSSHHLQAQGTPGKHRKHRTGGQQLPSMLQLGVDDRKFACGCWYLLTQHTPAHKVTTFMDWCA